jgi:type 2A phosphatase activator TIP41
MNIILFVPPLKMGVVRTWAIHLISALSLEVPHLDSGFFILMRFYLRVDNTLIRIHDSRFYFEVRMGQLLAVVGKVPVIPLQSYITTWSN